MLSGFQHSLHLLSIDLKTNSNLSMMFKVFSDMDLHIYSVLSPVTPQHKSCIQTIQNFSHPNLPVCFIHPHLCTCCHRIIFQTAYDAFLPSPNCKLPDILIYLSSLSSNLLCETVPAHPRKLITPVLSLQLKHNILHIILEHIIVMSTLG